MPTQMDKEFEETYQLYLKQKKNIAVCKAICEDLKDDEQPIPTSEQSDDARVGP